MADQESTMLRHHRLRHEREELVKSPVMNPDVSRKQAIDEAVYVIITDCQPLSLVEDEGFRELLQLLESCRKVRFCYLYDPLSFPMVMVNLTERGIPIVVVFSITMAISGF
ncbi:hypothetical protein XENORESO_021689 [Xenotaenia resolanae]|uniref:Uncharacterized protein n=1 Tax=Xenotaenia resolanae TaxID=208358 RepID=A0ABV0WSL4_9TELE